jgi:hypothetical protein
MSIGRSVWTGVLALCVTVMTASVPAAAQQQRPPNILVIMGDDVGWFNNSPWAPSHGHK